MAATVWMLAGVSSTTRMRSFIGAQEEAEGLAMTVQDVGRGRVELAELLAHLRDESFESLRIRRRCRRGCRRRRPGERGVLTQRGPQQAHQCVQLIIETLSQGLDPTGIATARDRVLEGRRRGLDGAG